MASPKALGVAMKLLGRVFAGDITAEKMTTYAAALDDLSDAQVLASVDVLIKTHAGQFLPVPAQIREACGANDRTPIDTDAIIRRIDRLGGYNPQTGWSAPRVETARKELGDAIADAYGSVGGGSRLFCDDETGRTIAERDFMLALRTETAAEERRALPSGRKQERLAAGIEREGLTP